MEQRSPDILIGIGKIRVERMITLSLQSVRTLAVLFLEKSRGRIDDVPRVIQKKSSSTR